VADSVTELLLAHQRGDRQAFERLLPLIYDDLKRVAARQRRRARSGDTLNTTALVHDVYLHLVDASSVAWEGRAHFFAIAARAMRHILIDHARERAARKRGGDWQRVELAAEALPLREGAPIDTLLALDRAFEALAAISERLVQVAECRLFAGMSDRETSEALSIPLRTVQRDWQRARAWLQHELTGSGDRTHRQP
jgi:RNA polymerase sigma factor (TIGR02999 family)